MTGREVIYIIVSVILFIIISWIVSSQKQHNDMVRKKKRCTMMTTGRIKDIFIVSGRRNGQDYSYDLAEIEYLDSRTINERPRNREIGDIQTVYYNPGNKDEAVSEYMMNESLNTNAFCGLLSAVTAFAFGAGFCAFVLVFFMGYSFSDIKDTVMTIWNMTSE